MMERRYEAYKTHVVKPFFRDHFARLDRQIVLVDMLTALNGGSTALRDLEQTLTDVLGAFRPGRASWLRSVLTRRIDRILFAATKADHVDPKERFVSFDITPVAKRLGSKELLREKPTVTIVPSAPPESGSNPVIREISLVEA